MNGQGSVTAEVVRKIPATSGGSTVLGLQLRESEEFVVGWGGVCIAWTAAILAKTDRYDDRMIDVLITDMKFLACVS